MIVTDNRDYSQKFYDRVGKDWKGEETHDRNGFPIKTGGDKKTPNPETDTGEGHNPKGGILGEVEKTPTSPAEIEAERRRQVTLPGEGPAQPERVYLSQQDALHGGIGKMTDGRIDPGDPTAAAPTGGSQRRDPAARLRPRAGGWPRRPAGPAGGKTAHAAGRAPDGRQHARQPDGCPRIRSRPRSPLRQLTESKERRPESPPPAGQADTGL